MTSEEINLWKGRISRAEGFQSKYHQQWEDAISLFNCDYFNKGRNSFPNNERVDVHFANWYLNNLVALVYFRDPYIFVKSLNDNMSGFAETMEKVINKFWKDNELKQHFKKAIMSGFMMPPGWMKIGYTAKFGQDIAKLEEEKEKTLVQDMKDAILGIFKDKKDLSPSEQGELNMYIEEESCFVTWIPSWSILLPQGYHQIKNMPYIIEVESMSFIDFKENPNYKNKSDVRADIEFAEAEEGKVLNKVTYLQDSGSQSINDGSGIKLYHVWDRRSMKRFTLSMQSDKPHFEGDWPYDMEGFPYKSLYFEESLPTKDDSNIYPPNALKPIMPQIIEQSEARTQMAKWRKRATAIILAQKGLLTEEDMRQLEESDSLEIKYISNIAAVQMTQGPSLPPQIFQVDEVIKQDLQSGTNMGQMMFQPQPGQRTATQAQIGQTGLQLKSSARVDVIEDLTVDVAQSLAQTLWQFYDRNKISEFLGEAVSPEMWPDLPEDKKQRRHTIKNLMQIRIDAGSTAPPKDETVDRKQILDFASIVMTIAPERIRKDAFVEQLAKKFKFAPDLSRIIISGDDEERMAAQEENQLLAAGIPQIVGPNELHEIHIQEHSKLPPGKAKDQHILDHGKFMGVDMSATGADGKRPPKQSSNPGIARQGLTNEGDVYQETQNLGVGTGPEAY